ncbi:hypothetical protein AVEN_229228-1 [Araneus ventricosus]|uniref:Peptidase aspartic putative domain-containing protein n=1 Tax=Araneus ventricosus TaxID=182803 RepID=A0A4Y2JB65_ARAVE|nr:hypothetical protein AVEN_97361-1 [Araneus ventricosus]GBM86462.1 hypothetical protein AVEN_229228-1 [Araneus ventricosus]
MKQMCALHVSSNAIQNDLKSLWEIDSLLMPNESPEMKPSDTLCNFGKELTITNNRYECPLQWKSPKMRETLGNNFEVAKKRFADLEKRFNHDESLFDRYNAVTKEQIQAGIIEMCSDECFIGYVMPHREVLRDSKSSTKTRIVYDASSKSGTNASLNGCLVSGENLNPNLIDVILKFREHKIAFCGDIARAFLQIEVTKSDRNYLCFLYYKNCDKTLPVTMYHFNRHCFDDLFYGSSTIQDAFTLSSDAVLILKDANMNMRKFDTNSKELKNVWLNSNSDIETNEHSDNPLKVLGLVWNNLDDTH